MRKHKGNVGISGVAKTEMQIQTRTSGLGIRFICNKTAMLGQFRFSFIAVNQAARVVSIAFKASKASFITNHQHKCYLK